ncbi:MAG TPA: F0F1 ATP synthase subunit epsilon [Lutibacter sp.]|nr:F0F1 ATP synthase subunit epsilon [Lutibacter sp.]
MLLEIVTPEATIFNSEVSSLAVPGINGAFQMLNNHAPVVSLLDKGLVKIKGDAVKIAKEFTDKFTKEGDEFQLAINSGTIEMSANKIIILAD